MTNSLVDHLCSRTKEPQSEEQLKKEHALMAPGVYRERKYLPMTHKAVLRMTALQPHRGHSGVSSGDEALLEHQKSPQERE